MSTTHSPAAGMAVDSPLSLLVTDVTGLRNLEFEGVDGHRTAADVAASVADSMSLPTNVPWALRDEQSARMLAGNQAIGGQVQSGAKLVVIPKGQFG